MAIKVFELAREMSIQSKELLEKAAGMGIELKSHMSTLTDGDVAKLKSALSNGEEKNKTVGTAGATQGARKRLPIGRPIVDDAYFANRNKSNEQDAPKENTPKVLKESNKENMAEVSKKEVPFKETQKEKDVHEKNVQKKAKAKPVETPKSEDIKNNNDTERRPIGVKIIKKAEEVNQEEEREKKRREAARAAQQNLSRQDGNRRNSDKNSDNKRNNDGKKRDAKFNKDARSGRDARNDRYDKGERSDTGAHRDSSGSRFNKDGRGQGGNFKSQDRDRKRTSGGVADVKPDFNKRDDKKKFNDKKEKHSKFDKLERKSLEKQVKNKHTKYKNNNVDVEPQVVEEALPEGTIVLNVPITVAGFCEQTEVSTSKVIMSLMKLGIMANINQNIDEDTVMILAEEIGISVHIGKVEEEAEEIGLEVFEDDEKDLKPRPPIITVMGHVDHGKTSLLDAIRKTNVTSSESGGITQHIGASEVNIKGQKIVFLDTPGHEAFTAMRARGAHITDIAVLVVAADDGVMPQTIESISHAKAAGVPIIVAINKMDKPGVNPDRVKQELSEHNVLVEEWGGDVITVPVSAKTGDGIMNLLEMILLQAEVLELKANPHRLALGSVIEARLDKSKGPVATLLVTNGTLESGQSIVAGTCSGRIRLMTDFKGKTIKKAGPATAVEILGLTDVPQAGDEFNAVKEDKIARDIAEKRKEKLREEVLARNSSTTLEKLFSQIQEGEVKELNLIIKGDVQGSIGALVSSLEKLNNEDVKVNIIHTGVGTVNESDIMLAGTSGAVIIGFNVRPSTNVQALADREDIQIRTYRVIYDVIDDVENAMKGMLDPEFKEEILGKVEIRNTFKVPNVGIIGGAYVTEGKVQRNAEVRLVRDGIVIHEGKISSLKRFKDDAKEVAQGYECGIGIENYNDIKEGDIIECFHMVEIERK
ncbi:MAG: translation initiation factor IF-2 [Eubacterium sp.]|nr:translation initiation factor IF-2 [Eubacterium sp.]